VAIAVPARRPVGAFVAGHPLAAYVGRRIAVAVVVLALVSVLVFAATLVLPGDAADATLGRSATPAQKQQLREELGLERPLLEQYGSWIGHFVRGDLGTSLGSGQPVTDFISGRAGNSLTLALLALIVLFAVSGVLGVIAGVRRGRAVDQAISGASLALIALPEFVTGTILAVVFGVSLSLFPPTSIVPSGTSPLSEPDILVLPIVTLCVAGSAYIIRMLRAGVAEAMASDYVQAARLNGVPERQVILRHALRNSLAPTVQVLALTVQWLIGGIVVVETVFSYPGLGQGLVQAVEARDIPIVQAMTLLIATLYVLINLLADVVVILLVPKLRTSL
jgi:peptide/nickel transport system permease protein